MARRLGSTRKGEEKRAPDYSYDQPETGQLELSYRIPRHRLHENELAFRLPFYCILCILRIVIERERETARNKRDYRSLEAQ